MSSSLDRHMSRAFWAEYFRSHILGPKYRLFSGEPQAASPHRFTTQPAIHGPRRLLDMRCVSTALPSDFQALLPVAAKKGAPPGHPSDRNALIVPVQSTFHIEKVTLGTTGSPAGF
jgi:hypothetical protein